MLNMRIEEYRKNRDNVELLEELNTICAAAENTCCINEYMNFFNIEVVKIIDQYISILDNRDINNINTIQCLKTIKDLFLKNSRINTIEDRDPEDFVEAVIKSYKREVKRILK